MSQADSFIRVLGVAANARRTPQRPAVNVFLCLNSAKKLHGNLKWLLSVLRARRELRATPRGASFVTSQLL